MVYQRQSTGGLVGGTILIGLGLLFLIGQFIGFRAFTFLWPFLIIGMGLAFFIGMVVGGKSLAGLAVPGSILTTIGLVLLVQTTFGHWEAWSYGWAFILTAVGIGIFIMGAWAGNPGQRQAGLRVAGIGLMLLIVFGSLFELLFFGGANAPWVRLAAPVLLIVAGLILLVRRAGLLPRGLSALAAPATGPAHETPPAPPTQA